MSEPFGAWPRLLSVVLGVSWLGTAIVCARGGWRILTSPAADSSVLIAGVAAFVLAIVLAALGVCVFLVGVMK